MMPPRQERNWGCLVAIFGMVLFWACVITALVVIF